MLIAAGIANGGVVMKPYLVKAAVVDSDLGVVDAPSPQELSQAVSPEVAAELRDMMVGVVQSGTGTAAQIPGVTVAGKTGTAEHAVGANAARLVHRLRAGHRPQGRRRRRRGGRWQRRHEAAGGRVAGPIARDIMKAVLGS